MGDKVGNYDVKWQERYGVVARIKAPLDAHFFPTTMLSLPHSVTIQTSYESQILKQLNTFTIRALSFCEAIRCSIRTQRRPWLRGEWCRRWPSLSP